VLNEYIAQSALPGEAEPLQSVAAARHPGNFSAAMGQAVPGDVLWQFFTPVFPPQAVQCVLLDRARTTGGAVQGGRRRQVVYVAYHSDGLYNVGWRVYEAQQAPFTPALLADLQAIGCDLDLQ
ncbi:MAG: hypothetical protein MUP62_03395, partial [Dehalococcoidia bacterium]|nr:hypothetical protein [Dehalococcoidia bacterium]